jgi:hypothetical protein
VVVGSWGTPAANLVVIETVMYGVVMEQIVEATGLMAVDMVA